MTVEERLGQLGLELSEPFRSPTGGAYPFSWARRRANRVYLSGHLPLNPDGTLAEPRGKVGAVISPEQAARAARLVALAMLGSLKRELSDLERVSAWLRVTGMVNAAPGFAQVAAVVNGFSDLVVEVYGLERGGHARSVFGVAELPYDVPVEIEAEVEVDA
jgi:enamine deaminase RidA (YjgF/YER057c/UK114 family)